MYSCKKAMNECGAKDKMSFVFFRPGISPFWVVSLSDLEMVCIKMYY